MVLAQARVDFHSDPLTFDLTQIFTKKRSKSASYFTVEGEKRYVLTLQFLDSPMGEFFPPKLLLFFLIWPSSSEEKRDQSWTKSVNSGYLPFL